MSLFEDQSCGCGPVPHPAPPDIPAGLAALIERQAAGFAEYREAMLGAITARPPLAGWRARGEADLGVMLLEAWAYVLDVTGFYDARTAERAFIGTAPDQASAQRLAALLGHRARGAMAARATLALEADGADHVTLPRGTGFRSEAFDAPLPAAPRAVRRRGDPGHQRQRCSRRPRRRRRAGNRPGRCPLSARRSRRRGKRSRRACRRIARLDRGRHPATGACYHQFRHGLHPAAGDQ
jgi:hypothetical protein